ncbi:BBX-like protein [Mya arenaria]|uniref:BBX-like protein n=1 Tax=Mya arenaria TaxID=6604 RepID=A0ABY7E8Y1_MYAAR|nr:BBX-like protein [Mya arenaria]
MNIPGPGWEDVNQRGMHTSAIYVTSVGLANSRRQGRIHNLTLATLAPLPQQPRIIMDQPGDEGERREVRRPMNAFLIFCKRHRSIVREKNPDLDNRSVTRILGDLWAKLKDDEKTMYTDLAKQVNTPLRMGNSTQAQDQSIQSGPFGDYLKLEGGNGEKLVSSDVARCKQLSVETPKEQMKIENSLSNLYWLKNSQVQTQKVPITEALPLEPPEQDAVGLCADVVSDSPPKDVVIAKHNRSLGDMESLSDDHEKENIHDFHEVGVVNEDVKQEESTMVTCGKMVVNHIIDKLYSSDISVAARKAIAEAENKSYMGSSIIDEDFSIGKRDAKCEYSFDDEKTNDSHPDFVKGFEDNNNEKTVYESDGYPEIKRSRKRQVSQSSSKGNESAEYEDVDDCQPLRKSRRRNKGARYQKLISDGIIQPSKERIAAMNNSGGKDTSTDESSDASPAFNSYILPETAMRRFRKRTTSESAKDKMIHTYDMRRYKTGDFDLEAQIATLPACVVENMGRKRGFARQRHNSECTHTQRKTSDHDDRHCFIEPPVFDIERAVCLPPHIRRPSLDLDSEPVVGSRKRKARKHSITHLLPAPATAKHGGKDKQTNQETGSSKEGESRLTPNDNQSVENMESARNDCSIDKFKDKTDLKPVTETDCETCSARMKGNDHEILETDSSSSCTDSRSSIECGTKHTPMITGNDVTNAKKVSRCDITSEANETGSDITESDKILSGQVLQMSESPLIGRQESCEVVAPVSC